MDIKIIPESANVFKVINGGIEIEIYCSPDYISITDKSGGGIEYPERALDLKLNDRVKIKLKQNKRR